MSHNPTIRMSALAVLAQNGRRMELNAFLRDVSCRILRQDSMHPAYYNKVRKDLIHKLRNNQLAGIEMRSLGLVGDGETSAKTWVTYRADRKEGDHTGNVIPFRRHKS